MSEKLRYLAKCYFHEDYDLIAETPVAIVEKFAEIESEEISTALLTEMESLLSSDLSEREAERIWDEEYRAYFDPTLGYGDCGHRIAPMSHVEWFNTIRNVLKEKLSDAR